MTTEDERKTGGSITLLVGIFPGDGTSLQEMSYLHTDKIEQNGKASQWREKSFFVI